MTVHYEDEVIQLGWRKLSVEWAATTTVETDGDCVYITQSDDQVVIPWCYIRDICNALEKSRVELTTGTANG